MKYYLYGIIGNELCGQLYLVGSYSNKLAMMIDRKKFEKVGFNGFRVESAAIEGAAVLAR